METKQSAGEKEYIKMREYLNQIEYAYVHSDHQMMMESTTALQNLVPPEFRRGFYAPDTTNSAGYLIRKKKAKVAHYWDGQDTFCRLFSTGGMAQRRYELKKEKEGLTICAMCISNSKKIKVPHG